MFVQRCYGESMRDKESEWREGAVLARGKQWVREIKQFCPIASQQIRSKAQH